MKIIILLCAVVLLASADVAKLSEAVPRVEEVGEVVGVIECINLKAPALAEETPKGFCGEQLRDNYQCYSNFNSLNLCLLNNKCFFGKLELSIKTECWNCWKDLPFTSDQFVQLQKDIAGCSENFLRVLALLVFALALLL